MLHHTNDKLREILNREGEYHWELYHTGGGCMVLEATIEVNPSDPDARRVVWLTRDEDSWNLGVYDFISNAEDEGVCVDVWVRKPDAPTDVAATVLGFLRRLRR